MAIEKATATQLRFTGAGCQAVVSNRVVIEVDVPGGRQVINFPVTQFPVVAALVATANADADVQALIVANTPAPEPEPEGEPIP
jgi:hypothetical protein